MFAEEILQLLRETAAPEARSWQQCSESKRRAEIAVQGRSVCAQAPFTSKALLRKVPVNNANQLMLNMLQEAYEVTVWCLRNAD